MVILPTKAICWYQSINLLHMLAFEFCQIFVTLGRIFSCSHDRDHIHQHIHANSYTVCYAKHVIHPPKINTPKSKEISLLVFLQKRNKGHWKKESICSRSIEKNVFQSKSIEKSETWPPSKIKERGESQSKEYLEKHTNIFHTLAHLDQVAWLVSSCIRSLAQQHHVAQVSLILILAKAPHSSHRVARWGSLKAFGEVANTTWAIEGTIWGTLSFFAKIFKKL
jgi:hypothetical protein